MARYKVNLKFQDGTTKQFEADDVRVGPHRLTWKHNATEWYWNHLNLNKITDLNIEHVLLKNLTPKPAV